MLAAYGYDRPGREFTAHHIVTKRYDSLKPDGTPRYPNMKRESDLANAVLERYDIDPNDAANGMYLPNKYAKDAGDFDPEIYGDAAEFGPQHPPLNGDENIHCLAYIEAVAARLNSVADFGEEAVRDELQRIAHDVIRRNFPGIPPLPEP